MIAFACRCGQDLEADDEMAGGRVKCPKCGSPRVVPIAEPIAEPAPRVSFWWNFYGGLLILVLVLTTLGLVGGMFAAPGQRDPLAGATLIICFTIALAGLAVSTPRLRD